MVSERVRVAHYSGDAMTPTEAIHMRLKNRDDEKFSMYYLRSLAHGTVAASLVVEEIDTHKAEVQREVVLSNLRSQTPPKEREAEFLKSHARPSAELTYQSKEPITPACLAMLAYAALANTHMHSSEVVAIPGVTPEVVALHSRTLGMKVVTLEKKGDDSLAEEVRLAYAETVERVTGFAASALNQAGIRVARNVPPLEEVA